MARLFIVRWSAALLVVALGAVLVATLTPEPIDRGAKPVISDFLEGLHRHGLPQLFGYAAIEFGANVVMFAPLGFLLTMVLPLKRWWLAPLVGAALSAGIELAQLTTFADRFASVGDVLANSIGAVLGAVLATAWRRRSAHRRANRETP